jgi:hypothetical protein
MPKLPILLTAEAVNCSAEQTYGVVEEDFDKKVCFYEAAGWACGIERGRA